MDELRAALEILTRRVNELFGGISKAFALFGENTGKIFMLEGKVLALEAEVADLKARLAGITAEFDADSGNLCIIIPDMAEV